MSPNSRSSGTGGTTPLDNLVISASLHVLSNQLDGDGRALLLPEAERAFFNCGRFSAFLSVFPCVFRLPVPQHSNSIIPRQKGELSGHR